MHNNHTEELRKKYIQNPPEGMTSDDIRYMNEDDLLDMQKQLYATIKEQNEKLKLAETEYAIRCTSNALALPAKPSSALTATPQQAAASA